MMKLNRIVGCCVLSLFTCLLHGNLLSIWSEAYAPSANCVDYLPGRFGNWSESYSGGWLDSCGIKEVVVSWEKQRSTRVSIASVDVFLKGVDAACEFVTEQKVGNCVLKSDAKHGLVFVKKYRGINRAILVDRLLVDGSDEHGLTSIDDIGEEEINCLQSMLNQVHFRSKDVKFALLVPYKILLVVAGNQFSAIKFNRKLFSEIFGTEQLPLDYASPLDPPPHSWRIQ
jgi:hypothetical protein